MARTSVSQLSFNFFDPPPAPVSTEPTWFKIELDKKGWSYGHIGIKRNDDGTWSYTTRDNFGGYCGHGGPFHGQWESFDEALEIAISRLWKSWRHISEQTRDSVCSEKHRAMARKGMAWLDELAAEYQVQH
ncbi:hypothetical protein [Sinorhizobium medicae]